MSDVVEFPVPSPEPTFVRPLDTAAHRRSRASRDSAAASTHSWVLMDQRIPPPVESVPLPEPVPALHPRPLPEPPRRIDASEEHMPIELSEADRLGPAKTEDGKRFMGGFVRGLRRLTRARKPRRGTPDPEGTGGAGLVGNRLPSYVVTPPTPLPPDASVGFVRRTSALGSAPVGGSEEQVRRRRHPSFRIRPPEDVQQGIPTPIVYEPEHDGEGMPGGLDLPPPPLENPYDHETTTRHGPSTPAASPRLSRADDRLTAPADVDDEPVSVHAHPLPTEDYRRMSAHASSHPRSGTTISSGSFSTESPSFSSELNGVHRFFNALRVMPWVASGRITVDWRPPTKPRLGSSWYTAPSPAGQQTRIPHSLPSPVPASAGTSPRSPPRRHTHRRAAPADVLTPPAYAYYPAFSPPSPPSPNRRPTTSRSHRGHAPRRHRRSTTHHTAPAPWTPPPLPPPAPTPLYIIQASPVPTPSPGLSATAGGPGSTPPASQPTVQMLAPVYMQMHGAQGNQGATHGMASYAYAYPYSYSPPPAPA
ncbi:hypothetical protein B0H15DRAFT_142706 [Mycena belliarum]|uniref:Uncharacterized protein n=1 Tax=Mycena belliarum TaxID=1033014 RepID=A0AAD6U7D2_9AGAR|nr:hypothetical protein B0H15DRAFT_142706 [Mycena belliae]